MNSKANDAPAKTPVHVAPAAQFKRGSLTDITRDVKSHARPEKKDEAAAKDVSNVTVPPSVLIVPTLIDSGVTQAVDNETEEKHRENGEV